MHPGTQLTSMHTTTTLHPITPVVRPSLVSKITTTKKRRLAIVIESALLPCECPEIGGMLCEFGDVNAIPECGQCSSGAAQSHSAGRTRCTGNDFSVAHTADRQPPTRASAREGRPQYTREETNGNRRVTERVGAGRRRSKTRLVRIGALFEGVRAVAQSPVKYLLCAFNTKSKEGLMVANGSSTLVFEAGVAEHHKNHTTDTTQHAQHSGIVFVVFSRAGFPWSSAMPAVGSCFHRLTFCAGVTNAAAPHQRPPHRRQSLFLFFLLLLLLLLLRRRRLPPRGASTDQQPRAGCSAKALCRVCAYVAVISIRLLNII